MTDDWNLSFEDGGGVLTVICTGELDLSAEPDLVARVVDAVNGTTAAAVVVELGEVTFMDSSGLRALFTCRAHAMERNLTFSIGGCSDAVRRLLEVAGVADWFAGE
ncbi:MAG: STAS domain-containing protein [Microthrixaceae bacterium]